MHIGIFWLGFLLVIAIYSYSNYSVKTNKKNYFRKQVVDGTIVVFDGTSDRLAA